MKHPLPSLTLLFSGMFLFLAFTGERGLLQQDPTAPQLCLPPDTIKIEYTGRIKEIIDQKCWECHSKEGEDEDAQEELLWDELPKLAPIDQVYTLDAIAESVEAGDMPPSKHLFWNPSQKLTDEEAMLLINWAADLSAKIYHGMEGGG